MRPEDNHQPDFLCILHRKQLKEYRKPKFGIGKRVCIRKYPLPMCKASTHTLCKKIVELLQLPTDNCQHTQRKADQGELICGNFSEKKWKSTFRLESLHRLSYCICATNPKLFNSALLQTFSESKWTWSGDEKLQFRIYPNHHFTKTLKGDLYLFFTQNNQNCYSDTIWNPASALSKMILRRSWLWPRSFKKDIIRPKLCFCKCNSTIARSWSSDHKLKIWSCSLQ